MTIEKETTFLGIKIGVEEMHTGQIFSFVDFSQKISGVKNKRLNIVEVNSPDSITVNRSLWPCTLIPFEHLSPTITLRLEQEQVNQSRLAGRQGLSHISIRWKHV